ncbi:eukaryotic aspartyl protease domain-containing protein [Ditylenchus destructor]|nr:eukaryotic aspartyl protease domain-containing protein [Ditylenchus destructor]
MNFIFHICCTLLVLWLNTELISSDVVVHQLIPSTTVSGKPPHKFDLKSLKKLQEAVKGLEKENQQQKYDEHYGIKKEQGRMKHKNGKTVPIKDRRVGKTPLIDYQADYYLVNISLGTPPQWFLLQPTQFSADMWVVDAECEAVSCVGKSETYTRRLFYKNQSSTFSSTEDDIFLYLYDANVVQDRLRLGGLTTYQTFALAYEVDSDFASVEFDGMLGLCDTVATNLEGASSPLQNLRRFMDNAVYTVWINGQQATNDINGGQLTFGGFDPVHCESDWTFVPVTNNTQFSHFWEFQISGFTVGNETKTMDNRRKRPALALIDFPVMLAPSGNVQTIAETAGFTFNEDYYLYTVDCGIDTSTLPDVVLKSNRRVGNLCFLGFIPYDNWGRGPAWAFGNPFLRNYCVSYGLDTVGRKVGIARSKTTMNSVSGTA